MFRTITLFFFLYLAQLSFSQNVHWAKVTAGESSSTTGCQIFSAEIFNDFLFTCGTFHGATNIGLSTNAHFVENTGQNGSTGGLYLSKSDLNGNVIQSIVFNEIYGEFGLSSMTLDSMGNIFLTATCWGVIDSDPTTNVDPLGANSTTSRFALFMKLDANMNVIWKKTLGSISGSGGSTHFEVNQVVSDLDGSLYVIGHYLAGSNMLDFDPSANTFLLETPSGWRSPYILKLDSLGSFVWAYNLNAFDITTGFDIAVDSDRMVYATGYISTSVDFDNSIDTAYLQNYLNGSRSYMLKLDSLGQFDWVLGTASSSGNSYGYSVTTTPDGKVLFAGEYSGSSSFLFDMNGNILNLPASPPLYSSSYIVEYDSSGSLIFGNTYGQGLIEYITTHDSDIIFSGFMSDTFSVETDSGTILLQPTYASGPHVLKLNSSGHYTDHLQLEVTGGSGIHIHSINIDDSDHIYLSGRYSGNIHFTSTAQNYTYTSSALYEGFQTKYDFNQNFNSLTDENLNVIAVYPNPSNGIIQLQDENLQVTRAEITDALGVHHTFDSTFGIIELNLPPGVYFLRLYNKSIPVGYTRMVISNN